MLTTGKADNRGHDWFVRLKRSLRIAAVVLLLAATTFWGSAGAHRGWTMTQVPTKIVDEVTGIEGVVYQKRFVPGLDFLGLSLAGAGILFAASIFVGNKKAGADETSGL